MLRDSVAVERVEDDVLRLQLGGEAGHPTVRLFAPESGLAAYVANHASDGLAALGDVGDDTTGRVAALALLSVHIEEALAVAHGEAVPFIRVDGDGLRVERR